METATETATKYDGTVHTITGTISKQNELEKILEAKEFYIIGTIIIVFIIILLLISINAYLRVNKELLEDIKEQNDMSQNILIDILEEIGKNNNSNNKQPNYNQYYQQQPNNTPPQY